MLFKWVARAVLIAGYAAVCIYAVTAETGPIGWINYAQQSVMGSYSQKLTMLVALCASLAVLAPLWYAIDTVAARMGAPLPSVRTLAGADVPLTDRGIWLSCLVAIPLIWIGGYAIWWWNAHEQQGDMAATYRPVSLARGADVAAPPDGHVAVSGRLLWERTVALRKGSGSEPEYILVPMVARDWHAGDAVPFVARVDNSNRYLAERSSRSGEPILGRTAGEVAVPAAQEFLKMGVAMDGATRVLRIVASEHGAPAVRDTSEIDRQIFVWLTTGISVFYVLLMGFMVVLRKKQARLAAAKR